MKKTRALTLRNVDKTAPMVAQEEMRGIYKVLENKVNERLEACYTEEDAEGHKEFYEPPDLKWYLQELRKTGEVISKLDVRREETHIKGKVNIMKIMAEQAKLSRDDREEARRKYVEVDVDDGHESDN